MEKNFKRCNFKIILPDIQSTNNSILVSFRIIGKPGARGKIRFIKGQIIDASGNTQIVSTEAATPDEINLLNWDSNITISFPDADLLKNSRTWNLNFILFDVHDQMQIQVFYEINVATKKLLGVDISESKPEKVIEEPDTRKALPVIDEEFEVDDITEAETIIEAGWEEGKTHIASKKVELKPELLEQIKLSDFAGDSRYADKSVKDLLCELKTEYGALLKLDEFQEELISLLKRNSNLSRESRVKKTSLEENTQQIEELMNKYAMLDVKYQTELEKNANLSEKNQEMHTVINEKESQLEKLTQKCDLLEEQYRAEFNRNKELEEKLKNSSALPEESDMEKHLNSIVEYMAGTAKINGVNLSNIYVAVTTKEEKYHVNIRGEITFADGVDHLSRGVSVKVSLYDAKGHIEIESEKFFARDKFSGFDTFDIGFNGGTKDSWLTETKIRIFVAA